MNIRTAELTGAALDWAAAKADGAGEGWLERQLTNPNPATRAIAAVATDWSQAGPIIEREGINLFRHNKLDLSTPDIWCAHKVVPRPNMEGSTNMVALAIDGPTPLIAAMRCFVASRLGDEVDVPKELLDEMAEQEDAPDNTCSAARPGAHG